VKDNQANPGSLARGLAEVDRLIHEPSRLMIVAILSAVQAADFLYLQKQTNLSKGNLSSHLSKLEEAGYICIEKTYRGKIPLTLCSLSPQGKQAFEAYRQQMKQFVDNIS
jgi:DNA-binding transcriptional ArsR family regulator